jgi:CPA2 family monovalent cation:H+ antiporter-2
LTSTAVAFAVLIGLFALARWGGRFVRPLIITADRELTTVLVIGFGIFIAGLAHVAEASDAVGALMPGMVVAGTELAHRVERLVVPLAANAALMLVSRGEFELILASLAVAAGLDERVAPCAALYVLVLSILSPLASARSDLLAALLPRRLFAEPVRRQQPVIVRRARVSDPA